MHATKIAVLAIFDMYSNGEDKNSTYSEHIVRAEIRVR